MKKLFMVLCSIFLITNSTFAADNKWTADKCKKAPKCFEWMHADTMLIVFFNNAENTIPTIDGTDCTNEIKNEIQKVLESKTQNVKLITLVGTASKAKTSSNHGKTNAQYAKERGETIKNLIQNTTGYNNQSIYFNHSEENSMYEDEHGCDDNNPYHRTVSISFGSTGQTVTETVTETETKPTPEEKKAIETPFEKLNAFAFLSAERNVWKDAEGKFNTSRLISDSVAGAVLGTATGLITGTVVKKNQIEDGFEDIKCTVGNQTMAAWGDSFYVNSQ